MGEFIISVPDDKLGELYEEAAKLNEPEKEEEPPQAGPVWNPDLVAQAVEAIGDSEKFRVFRVADARARVPVAEVSRDYGLPGTASLEQDFPGLAAFCNGGTPAAPRPAMPIVAGGSGDDGWYWMDAGSAQLFRQAIRTAMGGG